ncbi:hypothetical protein [uncultured Thermomonospora sp.]|uniref:Uncharacterized protein n=1 Tax=Thermomonospora curvata (strain ATCC 19995 / DSM 43183 / JCM 3096 / KCTC 9072 / NBRC 15933 / NCIMB 10081 / Henssen B9) TaxID=471852 RepID=D1A741_THECD|nr:hypothetical protein [uncultured Thermomonospora sp.]ACZ00247.1 hypothetical protein Tcur_4725 [Thermomonospora curvata DSM 43183]PKK12049.1 MAG: hypothetical protein BUE48_023175 [Thermomonospora sp. CIF 1]
MGGWIVQEIRPVKLESVDEPAPVPEEAALDLQFVVEPGDAEPPPLVCRIDDRPVDVGPGRWYIPLPAGTRKVTIECGARASFLCEAVKGRSRVIDVHIRPESAVPMVISAPIPPPARGLRSWNVRLTLVLLALFVLLFLANQLV